MPARAQTGRPVRVAILPETKEISVFKGSYRIVHRIDVAEHVVYVMRFWHGHREEPDLGAG